MTITYDDFEKSYPEIHTDFFKHITEADVLFIANGRKKGIDGYIGTETFAELGFGLAQNDEIVLWLKLGWIELMK
ncbi:hypothetical protein A3C94_01840 [Candidatus Kaiserbacteria bacterium RIFCSPHIGHO2_02_FULL_55_17]|uniref:Uncharacterized protein n=1 Tax=Candidatus Kaiserbacteria bacterium RIFCSPHIGHO2_02_FULL_55_17 TaxID=1798496 RepID=A0A1F6DTU1_9BACT|nr:MAG: hypothetical protein A3C94_01840 [Candidatus Kaiserbacteria bacterium RIFCSPHIGHO2_02_FULL_55_17]